MGVRRRHPKYAERAVKTAAEVLALPTADQRDVAVSEAERAGIEIWEVSFYDLTSDERSFFSRFVPGTRAEVSDAADSWARDVGARVYEIEPVNRGRCASLAYPGGDPENGLKMRCRLRAGHAGRHLTEHDSDPAPEPTAEERRIWPGVNPNRPVDMDVWLGAESENKVEDYLKALRALHNAELEGMSPRNLVDRVSARWFVLEGPEVTEAAARARALGISTAATVRVSPPDEDVSEGFYESPAPYSDQELSQIADRMLESSARNATDTEGVEDASWRGPQWQEAFIGTAASIRDSLGSDREFQIGAGDLPLSRALTTKEANKVFSLFLRLANSKKPLNEELGDYYGSSRSRIATGKAAHNLQHWWNGQGDPLYKLSTQFSHRERPSNDDLESGLRSLNAVRDNDNKRVADGRKSLISDDEMMELEDLISFFEAVLAEQS